MTYSRSDDPTDDRWDDFKVFLAVANSTSIKRAAQVLGTTQSAVSKRIDRLEHSLGVKVFERGARGTRLTYQGERVLHHVLAARKSLTQARSEALDAEKRIEGDCSILASDGIATYWIAQFLPAFFDQYPSVELKMILEHDLSAPRHDVFDIRLHYFEPSNPEQISKPLASVHFVPYASRAYLDRYGMPTSRADLVKHRVMDMPQYLTKSGSWSSWFASDVGKNVSLFTNHSAFLARCVLNGVGIGLMPTYMPLDNYDLVPLDFGLRFTTRLYASYHRQNALRESVKTTLAFLRERVFDTRLMPWFSDEFSLPRPEWRALHQSHTAKMRFEIAAA